jgi:hypothetical protein
MSDTVKNTNNNEVYIGPKSDEIRGETLVSLFRRAAKLYSGNRYSRTPKNRKYNRIQPSIGV